ncbi:iron complex outermembrane recepter protein [Ferrimonas sediminum]|uniref:Iron complex outermembrane recepter protein n=1 Tax=Ferrimonas sediminum TaxID=718193 RepID=A0A1G8MEM8_9GAMM|nr:TonB-dependent copper receptor [Ferrimonas sediminum]SDI66438.1 iron complex outermembrane recepter protein [Ferrimonas sediminum]
MKFALLPSAVAVAGLLSWPTLADHTDTQDDGQCDHQRCDERMVITAEPMQTPLTIVTDPKQPRQPLPAFDGSGFLRTIPGFAVTRKGGSGGDISLRGLGGSRINVVNDGQQVGGTCGGRMDPPTNYISPETYEQVTVIKGPQTVKYGPVGSAGTVLFERTHYGLAEAGTEGRASLTAGSFDRKDYLMELTAGTTEHYWSLDINGSQSDDFKDGDGTTMQSEYDRQSVHTAVGWTPDEDTVVELGYGYSQGSAEYADRANKARQIDNENLTLLARTTLDWGWIQGVEWLVYGNENDHIMDQFDRPITDPDNLPMGMNPKRTNYGGHLWLELMPSVNWGATIGLDLLDSTQETRAGKSLDELESAAFEEVFNKQNLGLFIESDVAWGQGTLFTGLRYDRWRTRLSGNWAGPGKDNDRDDNLFSGFARYEYERGSHQWYAGAGHAERLPDYWEVMKAGTRLTLDPETTNQLDIGWIHQGAVELSLSLFYADIQDYILIDTQTMPNARNIDATLWGGEAGLTYRFAERWSWVTTLAYSHGDNDTDDTPLGQVSPLEGKLALNYDSDSWSFGALWRLVAAQDRVTVGQGNIVGQDLGETAGFGVLSLNGAWKPTAAVAVSMGIDNLFDKTYAEHVSKSGAGNDLLPPQERTLQVNEPGRNLWVKLDYQF